MTTTLQVVPKQAGGWSAVRHYLQLGGKFAHATLACQVMAGFELKTLRDKLCMQGQRSDLDKGNAKPWQEYCKDEAGISDDKAARLIKMAEGVRSRFAALEGQERLAALLGTSPQFWSTKEMELVHDVVKQLTDGKTQTDFLKSLGLHREPDKTGGDHSWRKWCEKHHPELCRDGRAPLRSRVPKAVRKEFETWQTEQAAANVGKRSEAEVKEAKAHIRHLRSDMTSALLKKDVLLCGAPLLEELEAARIEMGQIIKNAKRGAASGTR